MTVLVAILFPDVDSASSRNIGAGSECQARARAKIDWFHVGGVVGVVNRDGNTWYYYQG
jgi:hypothetical protein